MDGTDGSCFWRDLVRLSFFSLGFYSRTRDMIGFPAAKHESRTRPSHLPRGVSVYLISVPWDMVVWFLALRA